MLRSKGYSVEITQFTRDFGVDLIIERRDLGKIAVQHKQFKSCAGVNAVQEVYAGGRYYDCTKFAVIAKAGFSDSAVLLAKKLGVYLCSDLNSFEYPTDMLDYAEKLLPVFKSHMGQYKLYELNGEKRTLGDWAAKYGKSYSYVRRLVTKEGVSLETALTSDERENSKRKTYTVRGFTGTKEAVCTHFGVSSSFVSYRMKHYPMLTLEEAIFIPKGVNLPDYTEFG